MNQIRNRLPQFTKNVDFCQTKYNRILIGSFSCSVGYIYTRRNVANLTAKTRLAPQVNAAKVGFPRAPREIFYGQDTDGVQENFQKFLWLGFSRAQEKFSIFLIDGKN